MVILPLGANLGKRIYPAFDHFHGVKIKLCKSGKIKRGNCAASLHSRRLRRLSPCAYGAPLRFFPPLCGNCLRHFRNASVLREFSFHFPCARARGHCVVPQYFQEKRGVRRDIFLIDVEKILPLWYNLHILSYRG